MNNNIFLLLFCFVFILGVSIMNYQYDLYLKKLLIYTLENSGYHIRRFSTCYKHMK